MKENLNNKDLIIKKLIYRSKYTGTKETSKFGSAMSCNRLIEYKSATSTSPLFGTNWSTITTCDDVVNTIPDGGLTGQDWAEAFAGECCSDKKGICIANTKLDPNSKGTMLKEMPAQVWFTMLLATAYLLLL